KGKVGMHDREVPLKGDKSSEAKSPQKARDRAAAFLAAMVFIVALIILRNFMSDNRAIGLSFLLFFGAFIVLELINQKLPPDKDALSPSEDD
ncbi:MAG: hypothetical protein ACRCTY_01905, partial [Candidatus Adiutrix sp.]